ncbi:MAG: tRNA (adenosine(37)-N6)-threonylcarbamoyltransferase complex transferase subunit TsaD [Holophagaceae bacterium]
MRVGIMGERIDYQYMYVLGLESSCDDCSASVLEETARGPIVRSLVRKGQDNVHAPYGGVVPELAAREHLVQIRSVIDEALKQASLTLPDLHRIAVTQGPGLVGSLLCTLSAAKAIAWQHQLPLVPVHHILGHLNAARIGHPDLPMPALTLIVSGGHTHLYLSRHWTDLQLIQKTRDDAAGEAFDKTARMLNLGYPGGPVVDRCGQQATYLAPPFTSPKFSDGRASWSFSGLKTGVRQRLLQQPALAQGGVDDPDVQALCHRLQTTIAEWLLAPLSAYASQYLVKSLIVSGGVACNSELRRQARAFAEEHGLALAIPEPRYCTDNGAMIASAGALLPVIEDRTTLNADPDLRLPQWESQAS